MPNHVVVIGSINVDAILHIQRLPQPGETIQMDAFSKAAGGKGANQAVAAARSGAKTSFIGRVGNDANAAFMRGELVKNQIDTQYVATTADTETGQAYILLQASGQNSIIIQHGANFELTPADVQRATGLIQSADFVVAELETPVAATAEAFKIAKAADKVTILNPAPAQKDLPEALLKNVDLIAPNETESELITGIPVTDEASMRQSAAYYHQLGIRGVVITLGSKGSKWSGNPRPGLQGQSRRYHGSRGYLYRCFSQQPSARSRQYCRCRNLRQHGQLVYCPEARRIPVDSDGG